MNITCQKCGHIIDVSESLKSTLLEKEVSKTRKEIESKYERKLIEQDEELRDEMAIILEEKNKIKEHELQSKKEKMILEDQLKSANIIAAENAKKEFAHKEEELKKANKKVLEDEKYQLLADLTEKQEALNATKDLELATKSLEVERLKKEAEDARKKLDHTSSSQELVGEAAELHLLDRLKLTFPAHDFTEIKKGAKGADILHTVILKSGVQIGQIYYESKKTKTWQQSWVEKFKDDIREKNTQIGILVTSTFPKNFKGEFAYIDDIWICSPRFAPQLSMVLVQQLEEVWRVRISQDSKDSLEGAVYDYITSDEFISKIKVIAISHQNLLTNLDKERIAMEKIWSARRKEIERSFSNVARAIGDLECLSDGSILPLEELILPVED